MKIETNNEGMSSVTFLKPSIGICVPFPVNHKKVPFRLLFLKNLCIPAGTNSYCGPWTTLLFTLESLEGFGPMRCFPKFYSCDCFLRLHYEAIISTDVISLVNILDRYLRCVISLS